MLLKLAWRNIWRNSRRTIISLLALAMGVTAIVSFHSFREVANQEMIRGVTTGLVGHVQVHGNGYQESPDMANVVVDPVTVEARIKGALPGAVPEKRVLGAGLAGAGERSTAAMVMGVEPGSPGVRSLFRIEEGRFLDPEGVGEAVVGTSLARELEIEVGGELVLVGQAADGSLANDRFAVVGTADAGSSEANATAVFLTLRQAQDFFALGGGVHQIIVRLPQEQEDLSEPVALLKGALDLSSLEVLAWTEILPELKGAMDAKGKNSRLIDLVVFLIVSLGILNTMAMSTFERTRELGVMASLGTRRKRILRMIILEALLLGFIGFVSGVVLAWLILKGIGTVSLESIGGNTDMLGAMLPETIELNIHLPSVWAAGVTALLTVIVGASLPAVRASRLKPVEATRYV